METTEPRYTMNAIMGPSTNLFRNILDVFKIIILIICLIFIVSNLIFPKNQNYERFLATFKDPGDIEMKDLSAFYDPPDIEMTDLTFWKDPVDIEMRDLTVRPKYKVMLLLMLIKH